MIDKIYIDLDDTLADFSGGVKKLGFVACGDKVETDNKMFDMIRECPHFYANLDLYPGSLDMLNKVIEKYGKDKVEILSGVPRPHRNIVTASEDKLDWCKKYLPSDLKINLCLRKDKYKYCNGKGYILIDDNKNNCKEWEKAGGTAIKFDGQVDVLEELNKLNNIL